MGLTVAHKLIKSHLLEGEMTAGAEIGIRIDQTLTQDATGTMVMLELEAMELEAARTDASCQYVDHNLIQADFKNPDDHVFLYSAAAVSGLTRHTLSSTVPERPGKFRGTVRKLILSVAGACPMPMQPLQPA